MNVFYVLYIKRLLKCFQSVLKQHTLALLISCKFKIIFYVLLTINLTSVYWL